MQPAGRADFPPGNCCQSSRPSVCFKVMFYLLSSSVFHCFNKNKTSLTGSGRAAALKQPLRSESAVLEAEAETTVLCVCVCECAHTCQCACTETSSRVKLLGEGSAVSWAELGIMEQKDTSAVLSSCHVGREKHTLLVSSSLTRFLHQTSPCFLLSLWPGSQSHLVWKRP